MIRIVKFFYKKEEEFYYCDKVEYPDGETVETKNGMIDWSGVEQYIGRKYVIIYDGCIIEAGKIKDYYLDTENYDEEVGVINFEEEIGDMNKYFDGGEYC